ncbi:MAG: glutathione S-transferase [Betaproteobacteria bacterium]|nr:MAG: glutathione S-transferase [Betaproteobacteria bacterium]
MKLYGSPTSPYVRKARVLIHEKNMPVEFVVEDPWIDDSPIILKNPLSKVPVLEIGADSYMFESQLVVHYLDHVDGKSFTPRDPAGYWQSQWWQALGQGIIDAGIARILEMRRPEDKQMPEKIVREEKRIARAIDLAEKTIKENSEFLLGNRFGLADIAMGVAMQYTDFRYPHDWRSRAPKLAKWLGGVAARPSFEETLPPGFVKPE